MAFSLIVTEDLDREQFDFPQRSSIFIPPFLKKSQILQARFSSDQSRFPSCREPHRDFLSIFPHEVLVFNCYRRPCNPLFPWAHRSHSLTAHRFFHSQVVSMDPHMVMVVTIAVDFPAALLPSQREKLALRAHFGEGGPAALTLQL